MQSTQQKVREAVKEQQNTVRNILQLAPVPQDEPDCRYCLAARTASHAFLGLRLGNTAILVALAWDRWFTPNGHW